MLINRLTDWLIGILESCLGRPMSKNSVLDWPREEVSWHPSGDMVDGSFVMCDVKREIVGRKWDEDLSGAILLCRITRTSTAAIHCRFKVAKWLTHLAATLEVLGSHTNLGDMYELYFLEWIQSPAQRDLKWYVWHCGTCCDLQCLRC